MFLVFFIFYIILGLITSAVISFICLKDYIYGRDVRVSDLDLLGEDWAIVVLGGAFWPVTVLIASVTYGFKFLFIRFFYGVIKIINWIKNFNKKENTK